MKSRISTVALLIAVFILTYLSMFYAWKNYMLYPSNYFENPQILEIKFSEEDSSFAQAWHKFILGKDYNTIYYANNGLDLIAVNLKENDPFAVDTEPLNIEDFFNNKTDSKIIKTPALAVEGTWADKFIYQAGRKALYSRYNYSYELDFKDVIPKGHPWLNKKSANIIPLNNSLTIQGDWYLGLDNAQEVTAVKDFLDENQQDYSLKSYEKIGIFNYLLNNYALSSMNKPYLLAAGLALFALIVDLISGSKFRQRTNAVHYLVGGTKARDTGKAYLNYLINFLIALAFSILIIFIFEITNWSAYFNKAVLLEFMGIGLLLVFLISSLSFLLIYALVRYLPEDKYA